MGYSAATFLADPDATDRLGRALAAALRPGDILLLEGQIGAGKTHLARAIIRSLLIAPDAGVPSPTFTLVQTYELADGMLWHVDLYRLADPSEMVELGLDEAMGRDTVVIEWPERLEDLPKNALMIVLEVKGAGRKVTLTSDDDRWNALDVFKGVSDA